MLKRIESNNTDRVVELPGHEIGDDGFEISPLGLGFAVNGAQSAEAVDHEVDGLIRAIGHDPRRPAGARHTHLLRNTPTFKHETGNCSCSKERPPEIALRGPCDRAGYIRQTDRWFYIATTTAAVKLRCPATRTGPPRPA